MKLSRRELLAAGTASVVAGVPERAAARTGAQLRAQPAGRRPRPRPPNLTIRDYLAREAARITDRALAGLTTPAAFKSSLAQRRREFLDMMGLSDLPSAAGRGAVPHKVTGVVERPSYRIEKLHYESLPGLHVTANLYLPRAAPGAKSPGVLYVCGHVQNQKVHYQGHAKRFAELGFPTLIVETVQLGEVAGYHHGCYREGWFHWYSRGYSPAAVELLNGMRGLDLLAGRPEVDAGRLGVTGISGGGATTWWIGAADERVKACSPVCGTAALESHIYDRVIDGHCDCMWWVNTGLWDLADVGALIAPRPLLIASASQDGIFPIASIRKVHGQLAALYRMLGSASNLRFVDTPGGHSYHERSRTAIFSFFLEHLAGRQVPPETVGDIEPAESRLEPEDVLRVYSDKGPSGNRALTIQDELVTLATAPDIRSADDLSRVRKQTIERLRSTTFNHFPRKPPDLDVEEEFDLDGGTGTRFAFTSEEGWRLHGVRRNPQNAAGDAAALVILRSPAEERNDSENFANAIRAPWVKLIVDTRGTGDTSWGDDLSWHVRRASAWTGRTVASMRVWDALRALQAARVLPGVDRSRIAIAARGEMAAVALYAALLDGDVGAVMLDSPPATQNSPGEKNGRGPAIEMLGCLRWTDLAEVAGLLYPARIVVSGDFPSTFEWAEQVYVRLGAPRSFQRVRSFSDWSTS